MDADPFPVDLAEVDEETLEAIARNACFAADDAALSPEVRGLPMAYVIRAAVRAALYSAIANRMVTVVPQDRWPEWMALDPAGWGKG